MNPFALGSVGAAALWIGVTGDFDTPASTNVREKIVGKIIAGTTTITPESGDQIGAFVKTRLVGMYPFSASTADFAIVIYGDMEETAEVDGAKKNERVTFKFFDSSTNTEQPLQVVNEAGETVNLTYQGQVVPPIELPGLDLTPTRPFDLRPGTDGSGGDGGNGGGGDGGSTVSYDVDGDGKVTIEDAAFVLRIVVGAATAESAKGEPDVDGDDKVTTKDAIAILRNR